MSFRWIVGAADYLELVYQTWKQARPNELVLKVEVPQGTDYEFDLSVFDSLSPTDGDIFIALDERFGNFKRLELMQAAMAHGFRLEAFVHPSAIVGAGAVVDMNVFVGPQAVIGHGTRIGYNTVIHAGVHIGAGAKIKSSCWVESGVQLGSAVELGAHCTIRTGALIRPQVKVGRDCELGWPRAYESDVPSKTVFDCRYDQPIHVYGH